MEEKQMKETEQFLELIDISAVYVLFYSFRFILIFGKTNTIM